MDIRYSQLITTKNGVVLSFIYGMDKKHLSEILFDYVRLYGYENLKVEIKECEK